MAAGVLFSFLSALALNTGNIVQKHGVDRLPELSTRRSGHLLRTLLSSKTWMLGLTLCGIGMILQVLAFALAPIAVVQSIFNAGIVTLVLLSRWRLGERLDRVEKYGIAVVIISVVCVSASLTGSGGSVASTGSQLRVVMAVVPTLVVAGLMVARLRSSKGTNAFLYGAAAGLIYGAASLGTKGASTLVQRYGLFSSIPHVLTSVYPYLFVILSVTGMVLYQEGLQRFRVAVVGSMSDVVCSTYLVAVGTVVFSEAMPKSGAILTLRFVGFAGVLVGSLLVAFGGRSAETAPILDADIGLGSVLLAGAHVADRHRSYCQSTAAADLSQQPDAHAIGVRPSPAPRPVPDAFLDRRPAPVPDLYELLTPA